MGGCPMKGASEMNILPLYSINCVAPHEEASMLPQLVSLLADALASGASLGFQFPLDTSESQQYWRTVFAEVSQRQRVLLVSRQARQLVGSVQLSLATNPNARHRAEVQK